MKKDLDIPLNLWYNNSRYVVLRAVIFLLIWALSSTVMVEHCFSSVSGSAFFIEEESMKKYKNKKWLHKMYYEKMLSIPKIAEISNIGDNAVWKWMKKYNIPRRSSGEAIHLALGNHCNLSIKAIEFLNGELLGDGNLMSYSKWSARFKYSSKYKEYIQFISNKLNSFGIKQSGKIIGRCSKGKNNSLLRKYYYNSRVYEDLLPLFKKWYPNGGLGKCGNRVVPKDIKLTPLVCRQWYIGDGSLKRNKGRSRMPWVTLATCTFSISDVEWLVKKLNKLGFKAARQPSGNTIYISTYSTKDFLKYIGKCPVKCYQYKWAY